MKITDAWPYPRWVAHRGAGRLAPENTLAAFRLGAAHGYLMFECDVKLSSDGVPFLMHDAALPRTTNAAAHLPAGASLVGGEHPWATLAQLDAGGWHSRQYAGEPLPTLDNVAAWCLANGHGLNIEIKPTPGTERETGEVVARRAAQLWAGQTVPPLLTSFQVEALAGARTAAPALPRGLLLDKLPADWLDTARMLGCVAVVCNHALWDAATVAQAKSAGLRCLSYTVNDAWAAQRLWDLGTDGIITDRVDLFSPSA
ncbi:glycerophosphodiester phosphodiesterase [Acidovorax sp. SRB_14]|uniref:glycerophosphodiester phosphodiesterase n=1 Tax=Acidovorax sp. SRB_14 TaxID=1962699 RepID=UPI0015632BEA|nr:glycerophosphodiester phosphodiesterase [Acidovorax sp. SRB_14]NMM80034.1 glycerophosphodiester phosphodiesterase [Acidovorax sp. SRB_14]